MVIEIIYIPILTVLPGIRSDHEIRWIRAMKTARHSPLANATDTTEMLFFLGSPKEERHSCRAPVDENVTLASRP